MSQTASLQTVQDYITEARVILQDLLIPYRYTDDQLLAGLNQALLESNRLRRDLFLAYEKTPYFAVVSESDVPVDEGYRRAVLFFICGHAQLRDEEETTDVRASAFLSGFSAMLTGG